MSGTNENYKIVGKGEKTIVFIHYFGGDAGSWHWLVERLKKNHTCILLNLPGFGGTEALKEPSIYGFSKFINDQITALKLKKYVLCGHSMGGKLALYAAKIMTGVKPKKIILVAPSPPTIENMSEPDKERMLNHPNKEEAINTVNKVIVRKLGKKRFNYAVDSQLRIEDKTWDWWILTGMKNNIADRIQQLDIPVHVIFSHGDEVITTEAIYDEVLPHLDKAVAISISRVGHLIPMEAPRKLAKRIKKITKDLVAV